MRRIFEVTDVNDLKRQFAALLRHMETNHREHRRFCRTKSESREYDAIIDILCGLADTIEQSDIRLSVGNEEYQ
jgi:hypothetical protein